VIPEIKFCGLTRAEDAMQAVALGAAYVGVIFAGGPRMLTIERASDVLASVPASVKRVGVFGDQSAEDIVRATEQLGLGVIQLHGAFDAVRLDTLRRSGAADIWTVCRVEGATLPVTLSQSLAASIDGLLLDAFVPGALGGTGTTLPWATIADQLTPIRGGRRIVLAGGLRPENVAEAIAALAPDVVDVSSGVESAPGIKNHQRMRAFRDAVTHASIPT
jgi:phosphoribosylanthranilate isomerase